MISKKAETVLEVINSRRSCRVYQEKSIPEEELNLILKAGRMAPSGGNSKTARVIVFQRKDMIRELEAAAQREFAQMSLKEGMYKSLYAAIKRHGKGNCISYMVHRFLSCLQIKQNMQTAWRTVQLWRRI